MKTTKQSLFPLIPLILAPFTLFLFGPIEMVMRNAAALWFTWLDVLPIVLVIFGVCFVVLCVIGLLLPEKIRCYYVATIWGLGLALYAQGNLMPVDYGMLDGRGVAWEDFAVWGIINTAIWILLLAVPILAVRFWRDIMQRAMIYVTCVIIIIQVGTVVYIITQPSPQRDIQLVVSREHLYTVSEHKNIVVLVLDGFDTGNMNDLLYEEPKLAEKLEGFVFFDNVVGMFPRTMGALPHMLTGIPNLNEMPYFDYLDMAFANAPIYQMLDERNFNVFIHAFPSYISSNAAEFMDNVHEVEWIIEDVTGMGGSLVRFAATRYFPHVFKEWVWIHSIEFFDSYRTSAGGVDRFTLSNVRFYNALMEDGLTVIDEGNVFSVIHLEGLIGATIDRDVQPSEQGVTLHETARGALQIAIDYLSHLVDSGVDDNTLFIVTADHGGRELWQNPLLIVRDPAHRAPFYVSSAPISFADLMPMFEAYVQGESTAIDYLHSAAAHNDVRTFFHYDPRIVHGWSQYLPDIYEYIFLDGRSDFANAQFTGIIHRSGNVFEPQEYRLGETITLARSEYNFDNPQRFFPSGLSHSNIEFASTIDYEVHFQARLDETAISNLRLDFSFIVLPHDEGQTIRLYAGEQFVDEVFFHSSGWRLQYASFILPKDSVDDENVLRLRFEFPDAVRLMDIWEDSTNVSPHAIFLREMTISRAEYIYHLGDVISFAYAEDNNDRLYRFFPEGLSSSGPEFTWTTDYELNFMASLDVPATSDLRLDFSFVVFPYGEGQTVRLYADEQLIGEEFFPSYGWEYLHDASFIIPRETIEHGVILNLLFKFPDAVIPADVWEDSTNMTPTAILLSEMTISSTEYNVIPPTYDELPLLSVDYELNQNRNISGVLIISILGIAALMITAILVITLRFRRVMQKKDS